jgi:hypothetical protein
VVFYFSWSPEVDMQNIKWAAERPRKDKFAVAGDGTVRGNAVRAGAAPSSDIGATNRPKESEPDAMKSFVYAHVTGGWGSVIRRKNVSAKGEGYNNKHEKFGVVGDSLENDELAVDDGNIGSADVISVSGVEGGEVGATEWELLL